MAVIVHRFDVWLVSLYPTKGSEIANTRLNKIIVVPLTSTRTPYPARVNCQFDERDGQVALDQVTTIDKSRLLKKIGQLDDQASQQICTTLVAMFTY